LSSWNPFTENEQDIEGFFPRNEEVTVPEGGSVDDGAEDGCFSLDVGGQVDFLEAFEQIDDGRAFFSIFRVIAAQFFDVNLDVPQVLLDHGLPFQVLLLRDGAVQTVLIKQVDVVRLPRLF